jgi:hypothetical protein
MESLPHPERERNAGPEIFGGQLGRQLRGLHGPLGGIARGERSHETFKTRCKSCIISLILVVVPRSLSLSLSLSLSSSLWVSLGYAKRTVSTVERAAARRKSGRARIAR